MRSSMSRACRRKTTKEWTRAPTSKRRPRKPDAMTGPAITLDNLREAQTGLVGVGERTPLLPLPLDTPFPVRLKAEHLQPIGAFKIRGAWTALRRLDDAARLGGVVTSS